MTEKFLEESIKEFPGRFGFVQTGNAIRTYARVTYALGSLQKNWPEAGESEALVTSFIPRHETNLPRERTNDGNSPVRLQITDAALRKISNDEMFVRELLEAESRIGGVRLSEKNWRAFLRSADKYQERESSE